ncbi:MAG: TIGR00159 family protein, partial [Nitrospirae bacterium]
MEFLHLIRWQDIVDITLISIVLYSLMLLLKGTKSIKILVGLSILFIVSLISTYVGLYTVNWVLQSFLANII